MSFEELYERRRQIIMDEAERSDRPVLGTICSYVPVELLHSMGVLPVRIWGRSREVDDADVLLQSYICPPVRHLMALGLEGTYDFLEGIVHCYTCDATCGLYNIWVRNLEPRFSHMISLPYMSIEESRAYAVQELRVLIEKLERLAGRRFEAERLGESNELYDRARGLMRRMYELKSLGAPVAYRELYWMNVCSQVLPVEALLPALEEAVGSARPAAKQPSSKREARILLTGSVVTDTALMDFVEARGGRIVADDTCLGLRLLQDVMPATGDPLESLAAYHLSRPPCASRAEFGARRLHLEKTIEAFDVDAVLFVHQKFCDPHLSDHPFLKSALDQAGIRSSQLELDAEGFTGQAQTRLESFLEMLEAR